MYEDISIIAAVNELISSVSKVSDEVREVVKVEDKLEEWLNLIDQVIPVVWRPEDKDMEEDKFGPEVTMEIPACD